MEGELAISPDSIVYVAVVPVDFSGNAIMTDLVTVSALTIDDGFANDGSSLPSVEGITLSWLEGQRVSVSWEQNISEQIQRYQVHISAEEFFEIEDARLVGDQISTTSFIISSENFVSLTNTSDWYISVTPYDEENIKQTVTPIRLNASQVILSEDKDDAISLQSILNNRNLLALGAILIALVSIVIFTRSRRGRSDLSNAWDVQAATWGIGQDSPSQVIESTNIPPINTIVNQQTLPPLPAGMNPPAPPTFPLPPIPQPVQQPVQPAQPQYIQPPIPQPVQPEAPIQPSYPASEQQIGNNQNSQSIDVSFLDELL